MAPGKYDIHIYRGEDFTLEFTIEVGGVLLDLTNATIIAQCRAEKTRTGVPLFSFTVTLDDVATPNPAPTDNIVKLTLTDTQTDGYTLNSAGYYDVLIIDSNGVDTFYLEGRVHIHNTVTVKP